MITILYQNTKTGDAFDITTLTASARWSTKLIGSPATLTFELLADSPVVLELGGILALKDGDVGIFYGYVFSVSRNDKDTLSVTAYDQIRYLKNKDTYVFSGQRADQITAQIAEDFRLKTGELANTGYVIPSLIEDNKCLIDIIAKSLDLTLINTGKLFCLWDDFGSLRITDVAGQSLDLFVGDGSLATEYTYTSDIDSETYDKIKLVRDNSETGRRDVYIFQDSDNMKLWGTLQHYEKVNEALNEAQIKARGDSMLELHNKPRQKFDVAAFSDLSVRAGKALFISLADVGLNQFFIVDEAVHDLLKETMNLKLKVV